MYKKRKNILVTKKPVVAILVIDHKFDVIKAPAHLISEGFRLRDWDVVIINTADKNEDLLGDQLSSVIANEFDLVLSITDIPLTLKIGEKSIGEYLKKPIAVWFLDSPIYLSTEQLRVIKQLPEESLLLFIDAQHTKLMRQGLEETIPGRFHFGFMPFGITRVTDQLVNNWNTFSNHEEKIFDLVIFAQLDQQMNGKFVKNDIYDYKFPTLQSNRFQTQHDKIQSLAESIVDRGYGTSLESLLIKEFELGALFGNEDEKELLQIFDSFAKRYRRLSLVQGIISAATEVGLKLGIYGTGWNNLKEIPPNCTIFNPSPYLEQFKIFCRSRAMLNLDPNWSQGVHDRVFNAISVGTTVLTNNNAYADQILHHNYDALLFNSKFEAFENLNLIKSRSQALAEKARVLISIGGMSWHDRISGLISFSESI